MVVDYLFDKVVYERMKLSIEEEEVFEVCYQYIFDRFNTIQLVAEHVFNVVDRRQLRRVARRENLLVGGIGVWCSCA